MNRSPAHTACSQVALCGRLQSHNCAHEVPRLCLWVRRLSTHTQLVACTACLHTPRKASRWPPYACLHAVLAHLQPQPLPLPPWLRSALRPAPLHAQPCRQLPAWQTRPWLPAAHPPAAQLAAQPARRPATHSVMRASQQVSAAGSNSVPSYACALLFQPRPGLCNSCCLSP